MLVQGDPVLAAFEFVVEGVREGADSLSRDSKMRRSFSASRFVNWSSMKASKEGVDVREEGVDEGCAAKVAGGREVGGETGAVQGRQHGVQGLAELDGLEAFGSFLDPGLGEGSEDGGEDLENGCPGDPLGKRFGVIPGQ